MLSPKAGRMVATAMLLTLVVFGGLVAGITLKLRAQLREEVLRRHADSIHAVALMEIGNPGTGTVDDVFAAVLRSKKLGGVFAVQLFDATGALREALPIKPEQSPTPDWPVPLDAPAARFDPHGVLETAYGLSPEPGADVTVAPLLEVFVPLPAPRGGGDSAGVARYWIDGGPVVTEFARLDAGLWRQAGIAFVGGAFVIALILAWAFAQLAEANRQLRAQSADLARANQELDFAAKTGAVGAITAHLIHGLKNPLSGLEGFVAENAPDTSDPFRGEAWRMAADTTRRLRTMVNEVVTVLREETSSAADYRVPVRELAENVRQKVNAAAEAAGVVLAIEVDGVSDAAVIARVANLSSLVLTNLLHNAIEASPRGGRVGLKAGAAAAGAPGEARVVEATANAGVGERRPYGAATSGGREFARSGAAIDFEIEDNGPGIPAETRAALFQPVRSSKPGGGGIGLTISYHLARHAGGSLELVRSDSRGTVFRLRVPAA